MINIERALAIPGWMTPSELRWLAERAVESQVIVEVGCWKGRSTRALADHVRRVVYAVDHWNGSDPAHLAEVAERGLDSIFEDFSRNLADRVQAGCVEVLRMDAEQGLAQVAVLEAQVDLVFIDASHTYDDVIRDIEQALDLTPAMLAGHDYGNPEFPDVQRAVDESFLNTMQRGPDSIWWVEL